MNSGAGKKECDKQSNKENQMTSFATKFIPKSAKTQRIIVSNAQQIPAPSKPIETTKPLSKSIPNIVPVHKLAKKKTNSVMNVMKTPNTVPATTKVVSSASNSNPKQNVTTHAQQSKNTTKPFNPSSHSNPISNPMYITTHSPQEEPMDQSSAVTNVRS